MLALAVLLAMLVFIAVELGPSLLGFRVFAGLTLIDKWPPWRPAGPLTGIPLAPVGDTIEFFLPAYMDMHSRFWSGDLPWWTNLPGPGLPLMSQPMVPTLTPTSIWGLLLPTAWSLGFMKLVQLVIAFAGMALWLRRLGTSWTAGMIAGLAYCGSGFFVAWANWTAQSGAAAFIPALFWVVERLVQKRTVRSALPVAAVVAFLLLSGFPAVAGHALYAGAAYFVVRILAELRRPEWRAGLRTFGVGVGAVLLGVCLAAIQLLPMAAQLLNSDLDYREAGFDRQLGTGSLLTTLFPRAFTANNFPVETYAYVGMGIAMLGGLALLNPRATKVRRGVLSYLFIGLLLSAALVWKHGWWTDWLRHVPVFSENNSGRIRDMVCFFACALAGIGAHLVLRRGLPGALRRRLVICSVGLLAVFGVLVAVIWRRHPAIDPGAMIGDVLLGLGTIAAVVVLVAVGRRRIAGKVAGVVLIALIGVQVAASVAFFWPTSPPEAMYRDTPVTVAARDAVADDRALPLGTLPGSTGLAVGLRTLTSHNFQPAAWKQLLEAIDPKIYKTATFSSPSLNLKSPELTSPVLDRMAVSTIVVGPNKVIPGTLHNPNGTPTVASPTAPTGPPVTVPRGGEVSIPITAQAVRGIQVFLEARISDPRPTTITAELRDRATSAVLATGSVIRTAYQRGWLQIPVAAEHLATHPGDLELRIGLGPASSAAALVLAGSDGVPGALVLGPADDGLAEVFAADDGTVWKRTTALPRVRWAGSATVVPTAAGRVAALENPALPDGTVVLNAPGPTPGGGTGAVAVVADSGDQVAADVVADGGGYLVLADSLDQGWTVTIDGEDAELVTADHAFGAVFVPAGSHRVEFTFTGHGLKAGISLSAAALVLVAVLLVVTRRRIRSDRPGPSGPPAR